MANFGLLGAGYIAQRHLTAIEETGNNLALFYDTDVDVLLEPFTRVPKAINEKHFFEQLSTLNIDYVSICSPSFLHYRQILKSLEQQCNVIVEKPICLNLNELEDIQLQEIKTNRKVSSLFQLRYHPLFETFPIEPHNTIEIIYQGKRNNEYYNSWKGSIAKSGGITSAVGIHYFDMLTNKYGNFVPNSLQLEINTLKQLKGSFLLERGSVQLNFEFLPQETEQELQRLFTINGREFNFSTYQSNLHTLAYQAILNGNGITTTEAKKSLEIVDSING